MADNSGEVRERLMALLAALDQEDALGSADRAIVTLDQQSVGRLSRMDALQRQAMAEASARRRSAERRRLTSALRRLDEGEYGYCTDCGEAIAPGRIELDPAVSLCVSCAQA